MKMRFAMVFILAAGNSACLGCPFSLGSTGGLFMREQPLYETREIAERGVTLSEATPIPTPNEGDLWQRKVEFKGDFCFDIEFDNEGLERVVVTNSSVPVNLNGGNMIRVGDSLEELSALGELEEHFGEETGMYLTVSALKNLSFHTECSSLPFEMTPEQKAMSHQQFLATCYIDKILAWRPTSHEN